MNFKNIKPLLLSLFAVFAVFACTKNSETKKMTVDQDSLVNKESPAAVKPDFAQVNYVSQSVDDQLAEKLKNFINDRFLSAGDKRAIADDQRQFQFYKIDLNNDGKNEIFVSFPTTYFCGTGGCTMLLLNNQLEIITKFSPVRDLYVDTRTENNWRVIMTETEDHWRALIYTNDTYPANPTVIKYSDKIPDATAIRLFSEKNSKSKTYQF